MSFLFIQQAREQLKAPKGRKSQVTLNKHNVEMLWRHGCKACPLNHCSAHTPKMAPTIGNGPVMFLAEAPGRDEDENTHRPLSGPSGRLLRGCIDAVADNRACSYDNVVNCRPPDNRTPEPKEIECCRPRRTEAIERIKPKLIVGLGKVPLHMMLGTKDLAGLRGRLFAVKIGQHACWFLPTYHPAYILRNAKNRDKPLNSMFGHCLRMDVEKAFAVVEHLSTPVIEDEQSARSDIRLYTGRDSFDDLMGLISRAKAAKIKAVDLETRGLRPYSADAGIMSAAISFNGRCNFSFAIDHPQSVWTASQKAQILAAFADLLKDDTTKIAHNAPFELEWLAWQYGPEIINHTAWECTMMQAHFIDERRGQDWDDTARVPRYQSLDFLVNQYFGLAFKKLFKINKKDTSKTDLQDLLPYNACDTKFTLKLYHAQKQALGTNGDRTAYRLALMQQPTVALMQHFGVDVDQRQVKAAQRKLGEEITALEFNIQNLSVVKQYAADNGGFNPGSNTIDVLRIFRDYLKRPEVVVKAEHGDVYNFDGQSTPKANAHKNMREDKVGKVRYSVDKNVLAQISHPLAKLITNWRNVTKLKSTYVDGLDIRTVGSKGSVIYPDGKLHTSFNTTATETGRLSSDSPNLQNYPNRRDKWIRQLVCAPAGHVVLAIDYGQLEACTGAMCSKDTYLVKALWDDYDIHMEWAKLIAKEKPEAIGGKEYLEDKQVMKTFRSLIKNKMVFPAFYGASAKSIAGYLTAAIGMEFTEDYVEDLLARFWHVLSGMKKWQDNLVKTYYETGWVASLGGRKHRYPLNANQAINHPFQSTAAELVCDAMDRLSYMASQTKQWFLHPLLNIHDDLTFYLPDDDATIEKALRTIMREMMVFDFPWVNVPLSLEVSIGYDWANLKPLGKYWSHREFGYPAQAAPF